MVIRYDFDCDTTVGVFQATDFLQYQPGGALGFGATNVFWRQIRNFIIDLTDVPSIRAAGSNAGNPVAGIHWPTAQATSLQNIVFLMSEAANTGHEGVFLESGSGGFMTDLVFHGGQYGIEVANQYVYSLAWYCSYNELTVSLQAIHHAQSHFLQCRYSHSPAIRLGLDLQGSQYQQLFHWD
jgi:hypothetical protein